MTWVALFLPRASGSFPTIFLRTPYESLHQPHIEWAIWWARRGYAVAIQDCRGRFKWATIALHILQ